MWWGRSQGESGSRHRSMEFNESSIPSKSIEKSDVNDWSDEKSECSGKDSPSDSSSKSRSLYKSSDSFNVALNVVIYFIANLNVVIFVSFSFVTFAGSSERCGTTRRNVSNATLISFIRLLSRAFAVLRRYLLKGAGFCLGFEVRGCLVLVDGEIDDIKTGVSSFTLVLAVIVVTVAFFRRRDERGLREYLSCLSSPLSVVLEDIEEVLSAVSVVLWLLLASRYVLAVCRCCGGIDRRELMSSSWSMLFEVTRATSTLIFYLMVARSGRAACCAGNLRLISGLLQQAQRTIALAVHLVLSASLLPLPIYEISCDYKKLNRLNLLSFSGSGSCFIGTQNNNSYWLLYIIYCKVIISFQLHVYRS